jgi:hypothetical protein
MIEQVLLCGDCTAVPPASIGHTVLGTDPPYSPRVHNGMVRCAAHGARKGVRQRDVGFAALSPELRSYLAGAAGVATRWTLIYSDIEGAGAWAAELRRHVRTVLSVDTEDAPLGGPLPWLRWSMPQLSGDRPPSGGEAIVLGHGPGKMHWGGPGNLVALCHACERGEGKHPTAKPLDQALDLVAWFSDPGDFWYDPCAGRGTFGVACSLLGREYVGFELNPTEAALGSERIEEARHGRLIKRDVERLRRWLASLGISGISGKTQDLADADQAIFGAHFRKGLIWTPPAATPAAPEPDFVCETCGCEISETLALEGALCETCQTVDQL